MKKLLMGLFVFSFLLVGSQVHAADSSITVISPNGGEAYNVGDKITIRWTTENISADTSMYVCIKNGDDPCTMQSTLNTGEAVYDLTNYSGVNIPGNNFKAIVRLGVMSSTLDSSDNSFTINSASSSLPDLIADDVDITPRSGQDTQRLIEANIINNTDVSANTGPNSLITGDSFINRIEIYSKPNGGGSVVDSYNYLLGNLVDHSEFKISKSFKLQNGSYSVRVCADATSKVKESNESNNCSNWENFEVSAVTPDSSITVTSPNGGEVYQAGQQITVKWNSNNISSSDSIWLNLYMRGSSSPSLNIDRVKNTGSATITLPINGSYGNLPMLWGNNFKIVLEATSGTPSDSSDNLFTIKESTTEDGCKNGEVYSSTTGQKCPTATPSITVLSPNGGEKIDLNTPLTIKWNTKDLDPNSLLGISITVYKTRNDAINNIESNLVGTTIVNSVRAGAGQASVILGSENLTIIPMINEGINFDNVKLEIFNWEPYHTISDTSNLPFSIISNPTLIPSITVLSPNGGETYKPYDQITVKWKSKNIDSNKMVNIYLSAPDQSDDIPLISNTPNDGVQSVVITPEQLMKKPGVTSFKILVVSSGLNDFSDNYFTIGSSTEDGCKNGQVYSSTTGVKCPVVTTTPSITVLSPNGGETFYLGDKINVKWKSNNLPSNAKVAVYLEEMPNSGDGITRYGMNQEMLINDGEEVVALTPSGVLNKYGKYFKIAIVYYVDGTVVNVIEDTSDNYFTINAPSASLISQCLRDKGAVLYTASWCSHCQNQEKLFGDYFGNINQVECSNSAGGEQSAVCNKENITGYPTWKFKDGSILNGTQSLSALAEKVGCNFSTKIDDGCSAGAIYSSTTGNPCNTSAGPNNVYTSYNGQSLGTGSSTSSTVITRTLKIGIKGDDVKTLQAFLNLLADGSFGPKTQAKVMEWQSAHGLTADGSFGPMSRQKAGLAQ